MRLLDWVESKGGYVVVGELLGVTRQAVYYWSSGRSIPNVEMMRKIVAVSNGAVSLEEIVNGARVRKRKAKRGGRSGV